MTKSKLMKMKVMDLANLASDMGLAERDCWLERGGPLRKEILIENILKRQEYLNKNKNNS